MEAITRHNGDHKTHVKRIIYETALFNHVQFFQLINNWQEDVGDVFFFHFFSLFGCFRLLNWKILLVVFFLNGFLSYYKWLISVSRIKVNLLKIQILIKKPIFQINKINEAKFLNSASKTISYQMWMPWKIHSQKNRIETASISLNTIFVRNLVVEILDYFPFFSFFVFVDRMHAYKHKIYG